MNSAMETVTQVALPGRTVTFLVAGIAGIRRLQEAEPDEMRIATANCYAVLGHAISQHGGVRIAEPRGAGVAAMFARASDALGAAIDAQAALDAEAWPTMVPVHARIALHADTQSWDAGGALSRTVDRCAQLGAVAHGGQTVLSHSAQQLVADRLPDGTSLVDLGVHRLRDLNAAERVFELAYPGHTSGSPPLSSLDAWPNNLPEQFTSFVGRGDELDDVGDSLARSRLVVLTGAGGCGKTRLALQAAAESTELAPDGAWCVELATLTDGELIGSALANVLDVRPTAGSTSLQAAIDRLHGQRALIVLDNCEHVLEQAANVCEALRRGCPQLMVLATSREPLGVAGERDWRVPPLAVPAEGEASPARIGATDAGRLFEERAAGVHPGFVASGDDAPAIARICRELDGIPLAIELAAARMRALSVAQIADGLRDRFRLLTGGGRGAIPRHQTLRASVDWSHALLTVDERLLFRRLAVFAGGWSLDGAQQICAGGGLEPSEILDLVASLVDKSLVLADEDRGVVRYRMLETVRQYALELISEAGEVPALRERHLGFFLALAQRVAPRLVTPDQRDWLDQLDPEAANFAVALRWATEVVPERALILCEALTWWWMCGRFATGERACGRALAATDPKPTVVRGRVTWGRAMLARHAGAIPASVAHAHDALEIAETVGDRSTAARAMWTVSALQLYPDPVGCRVQLHRALELAREAQDDWLVARATSTLAYSHLFTDEIAEAERLCLAALPLTERVGAEILVWYWLGLSWGPTFRVQLERCFEFSGRAVAAARAVGDPVPEALAHNFMGALETATGRPEAALARLQASEARVLASGAGMALAAVQIHVAGAHASLGALDRARQILEATVKTGADHGYNLAMGQVALANMLRVWGDAAGATVQALAALEIAEGISSRNLASGSREVLGRLAAARREWAEAENFLHAALGDRAEADLQLYLPQTLVALAEVAAGLGSYEEAARLLGAARRGRTDLGIVCWPPDEAALAQLEESVCGQLGETWYVAAHAQGGAMALDEAIAWCRRARGRRKRPASGWESLTPTELRVVSLVSEGLTNPQIAERMFISRATVKVHLAHVFQRLGVRTRAELTAQAVRREG